MAILLWFLLLILAVICFILASRLKLAQKTIEEKTLELQQLQQQTQDHINGWKEYSEKLQAEIKRLSPWRGVADADQKAKEIIEKANAFLHQARADSLTITTKARSEAEQKSQLILDEAEKISEDAKRRATEASEHAKLTLDSATRRAKGIIDLAEAQAREIGGDAYEALQNSAKYKKAVKAMKNILDGYGNLYLIPHHSLLDDLAQELAYSEPGKELKLAREHTKMMITNGSAATCDYVEQERKNFAIQFVIDAFNGKVDSILSRVKNSNYGILRQEILDSFQLVNHNGRAFRNAQISQQYCDARIEELKWAVAAHQLKLDQREEQRLIKEQIREEEKARREYERALKEASKEEEAVRKAMEKIRAQFESANDQQREKYELQLRELNTRLQEAEDRNKRAISMAQQTKRGHVYVISNIGSFGENVYKIGMTRRLEPNDRIRELGDSSVPFSFDVHALILSDDAPALENQLHKQLLIQQVNKVNHRKEFFKVSLEDIRKIVSERGLEASWTMQAQAQEYFETLAIEQQIDNDPATRQQWLDRQLKLDPVGSDIDRADIATDDDDE